MSTDCVTLMKRFLPLLLLAMTAPVLAEIEYREELAPPDVNFYLELHGGVTDFANLGGDEETGFRVRLGIDMNDTRKGNWLWRAELGLNQFGENRSRSERIEDNLPPTPDSLIETTIDRRLTGIELGARALYGRFFYLRGGALSYNLRTDTREVETELPAGPSNPRVPQKESSSGIGPYLGAGVEVPLVESAKLVIEYNSYRVEKEQLGNLSAGIRFEF